jgi:dGTPase
MDIKQMRQHRQFPDNIGHETARATFERDYSRLIHSPTFRRLQGKSQIFGAGTGDYYRTRLTHSLEVAQIAREAARSLLRKYPELHSDEADHPGLIIDPEVVECAAISHDFGHPPFGHKGEEVLQGILTKLIDEKVQAALRALPHYTAADVQQIRNEVERKYEHFEGNAHNFRLMMFLEKRENIDGLNLSDAVLLGTNKYPFPGTENKKGLYQHEWAYISYIRDSWSIPYGKKTLEAQLMDLCDDIAYSSHDLEDGIKAGKIQVNETFMHEASNINLIVQKIETLEDQVWRHWSREAIRNKVDEVLTAFLQVWKNKYAICGQDISRTRREVKAYWVSLFVTHLGCITDGDWKKVTFVTEPSSDRIFTEVDEDEDMLRTVSVLKSFAWVTMVSDLRVQRLQKRSAWIITRLWDAFIDSDTSLAIIPSDWLQRFEEDQRKMTPLWTWEHMIVDYIAGMTDAYAEKVYNELYGLKVGSIYDLE